MLPKTVPQNSKISSMKHKKTKLNPTAKYHLSDPTNFTDFIDSLEHKTYVDLFIKNNNRSLLLMEN